MTSVYALYGKMGKVVYFQKTEYTKKKTAPYWRKFLAPDLFAGKHLKTVSFQGNPFDLTGPLNFKHIYKISEVHLLLGKAAYSTSKVSAEINETADILNAQDRPFEPIQGDYILLTRQDGIHTEEFSFAAEFVAEGNDYYVVKDMYGNELTVEPLPERDSWPRKAWKQVHLA